MPYDPSNPHQKPTLADAQRLLPDRFTATGNVPDSASVMQQDGTFPAPTHFSDEEWYTYTALRWVGPDRIVVVHSYPVYPLGIRLAVAHRLPASDRARSALHYATDFVRQARAIVNALTTSGEKQERIEAYEKQGVFLK